MMMIMIMMIIMMILNNTNSYYNAESHSFPLLFILLFLSYFTLFSLKFVSYWPEMILMMAADADDDEKSEFSPVLLFR